MEIYNTLTKKVEFFIPNEYDRVKMYTCGPTVYNYAHIGNLRTYIFEDVLERTLKYLGYKVKRVMNITDVGHMTSDADTGEDKMLKEAKIEGKSVLEIADFYTEAFFHDTKRLKIRKPRYVKKASDFIDFYIKIISNLMEKGYAYRSNGNIYFDVSKVDDYYKLTSKNDMDLIVGAREDVEEDKAKRNPFDFVLWFTTSKFENQALKWDSPWGYGYPGWHIECTGISIKFLGRYLDIHCGGVDNIFPHHTNEIAQSEAFLGHKWCNYWVHGEHLNDSTGKMSKSKGEFLTLSLLESKGYNPLVYRFFCLQSHYRKQLNFSYDSLDSAASAYNKLRSKIKSLTGDNVSFDNKELEYIYMERYNNLFRKGLEDDLNTANALTCLFDLIKDEKVNNYTKIELIKNFDKVLALNLLKKSKKPRNKLTKEVMQLIKERDIAKLNMDYIKADKIRDELKEKGIIIKDSREGTTWEIIK